MLENSYPIRTDLALESQERLQEDQADMRGIRVLEERRENGVIVSTVMIETENASVAMGRPKGTYITIEAPEMIEEDAGYHRDISLELAKIMRNLLPGKEIEKNLKKGLEVAALVVGLGNREVTPDALGPRVVDNLFITRHILNEFGKYAFQREDVGKVSGITPGSGIGNHRNAINRKSVGVPVISLGVPTVVDAATIVSDAMTEFISALSLSDLQKLDERERQELARELLSPQLNGLFVTPKNIDDSIKNLSFLISEGLNIALLGDKEE